MHGIGGGPHFSGIGGGPRFGGARFAGNHFAHAGGFHHRHGRFAFGAPYAYSYDSCWRPVWTAYGRQWVDVCGDYGY